MSVLKNDSFAMKADALKKTLKHLKIYPLNFVTIEKDIRCFQMLKAVLSGNYSGTITLNSGESVIVDFGDHYVG